MTTDKSSSSAPGAATATDDEAIDRIVIHPAIGIARVGNSPEAYFVGPEVPGPHRKDPDDYRDGRGCIKRQAARFRLYAVNAAGRVLREITAAEAEITWTVHVANSKAAWYDFDQALDIPASKGEVPGVAAIASTRRNVKIQGADRDQLRIDPGPRTIAGADTNVDSGDARYAFDTGAFFGKPVYLGELRTDEAGRLVFLGGRGLSASEGNVPPQGFANSDGWHDDTSDGPVDAVATIGGRRFVATGAWVLVAPPDYAPGVRAIVTAYDLIFEVATRLDPALAPTRPSFARDIEPLLARFPQNQWVNQGFAREFGWGSPSDFSRPALRARLGDPSDAARALRQSIFDRFRDPAYGVLQASGWPAFYGDAVTLDPKTQDPREWMAVLDLQYRWLRQWAEGDFDAGEAPLGSIAWDELAPAVQAAGLDRAALDEATGGPFHPGAELTWPMRQPLVYDAPFRIKRRAGAEPDFGPTLTSAIALAAGGPLDGAGPGDLTRWMACPWQTDTASCLSAYRPFSGEYAPTFWPARVPNDVLTEDAYRTLMDPERTTAEQAQAFGERRKWLRGIVYREPGTYPPMIIKVPQPTAVFVDRWHEMGIITQQPGPADRALFPDELWVETGRTIDAVAAKAAAPERLGAAAPGPVVEEPLWEHNPRR